MFPTLPQKILPAEKKLSVTQDPKYRQKYVLVILSKVSIFHHIQPTGCPVKLFTPAFKSKFCQMQKMVLHLKIDLELAKKILI